MIPKRTRRLRARAATANTAHDGDFEDYGPEPNMKLSHAFLVVLLLHVVAVGGLYAFNSMKAGKVPKLAVAQSSSPSGQSEDSSPQGEPPLGGGNARPPQDGQPPIVAKPTGLTKPTQSDVARQPHTLSKQAHETSLYGSFLKKAAAITAGLAGGSSKAGAEAVPGSDTTSSLQQSVPSQSVPAAVRPKTYTVVSGDTITRIASSLGVSIPDLEKANSMTGNSVLRVGQILKVPEKPIQQESQATVAQGDQTAGSQVAGSTDSAVGTTTMAPTGSSSPNPSAPSPATASVSNGASNAASAEYTVVKGDSPYRIAKHFKITPDELMKANNITDPKKIQIGQKLIIPASKKSTH